MEFLFEYGLFLAKALTLLIAVAVLAGLIVALPRRHRHGAHERVEVNHLNHRYDRTMQTLESAMLPKCEMKQRNKARKQRDKARRRGQASPGKRLFVLDFHGDIRASEVAPLRETVTAVLTVATPADEVLVRLESAGGMVHAYGLAASQLKRIRDRGITLTVAVDKVAASGGYLMACVANRIIAAPFAVLGSIGVVSQIPNFHRLLKKHDIDFEQITAGEHKRTVTLFGETTDKARDKLRADMQDIHTLFKDFVRLERPQVDIDAVATGEHWLGTRALELQLVDQLQTSDDYLMAARKEVDLYQISYQGKQGLKERLGSLLRQGRAEFDPLAPYGYLI